MYCIRLSGLCHGLRSNISQTKIFAPVTWSRAITSTSVSKNPQSGEDYWTKNERLKRPISPHMTIYKPQVTSLLSLAHRGTGIMLSMGVAAFSIGMLALPCSFPHYLGVLEAMHYGSGLIFLAKFSIAFPFIFHIFNGMRHLAWDLGYGFGLRNLYKSGYLVLGSSVGVSALISCL